MVVGSTDPAEPTPVATLSNLPAGSYAITAKTVVHIGTSESSEIACMLQAPAAGGGDVDTSRVFLNVADRPVTLAMQVVHTYNAAPGDVRVACAGSDDDTTVRAQQTKIQAIQVTSATNSAVGG